MKFQDLKNVDVRLWGELIGKIAINENGLGHFKYSPSFAASGVEPSPIWMPVKDNIIYKFPKLNQDTFKGLPGMIVDSLPDAYGDKLLDLHFSNQGIRNRANIELLKLCYINSKATGALEFSPPYEQGKAQSGELILSDLLEVVDKLVSSKQTLKEGDLNNIQDIVSIGSSLGGAAPKAVIGIDFNTKSIRPGNIELPNNYDYWIIKFDSIKRGSALDYEETTGFGNVEYVYSEMAKNGGIEMTPCHLYRDKNRSHFMTKRFDRVNGERIHMQTLHGLAHMDSYARHDYKTYFRVLSKLKTPYAQHEEMFRRIVFNGLSGNTDTHTKNTSFLMDKKGKWSLSPCYDLICSVSMRNNVEDHKTLINGKANGFVKKDFLEVAKQAGIKNPNPIIDQVAESLSQWRVLAKENEVKDEYIKHVDRIIEKNLLAL